MVASLYLLEQQFPTTVAPRVLAWSDYGREAEHVHVNERSDEDIVNVVECSHPANDDCSERGWIPLSRKPRRVLDLLAEKTQGI